MVSRTKRQNEGVGRPSKLNGQVRIDVERELAHGTPLVVAAQ
jgi:hypothetical protein